MRIATSRPPGLGERLFRDPKVSTSPFNAFACAHCHAADPAQPAVVPGKADSGYNLGNSVGRPSWWGGYEVRLLDAINVCIDRFMGGRKLKVEDAVARQLYAFLEERSPEPTSPAAKLTLVRNVTALDEMIGDPAAAARSTRAPATAATAPSTPARGAPGAALDHHPRERPRDLPREAARRGGGEGAPRPLLQHRRGDAVLYGRDHDRRRGR